MITLILKLLILTTLLVVGAIALFHVFPYLLVLLALIGTYKLYQNLQRPKRQPSGDDFPRPNNSR